MKVYVTIEFYKGLIEAVKAFTTSEAADAVFRDFLREYYAGSKEGYKEVLENAVEVDHELEVREVILERKPVEAAYAYFTDEELNEDLHNMFRDYCDAVINGVFYERLDLKEVREKAIDEIMVMVRIENEMLSHRKGITFAVRKSPRGRWENYQVTQHVVRPISPRS